MEAAADLVVDAATRHRVESARRHVERRRVAAGPVRFEQHQKRPVRREFRRLPEAAVLLVERRLPGARGAGEEVRPRGALRLLLGGVLQVGENRGDRAGRGQHLVPAALPSVGDGQDEPFEFRLREIGPAEERLAVRRQKDRHRPAAAPGHEQDGVHVDRVEVRALLAVHLDRYEAFVQETPDLGVGEHLALHDVTPVTGGVADRQEDRPALLLRHAQRLAAPGVPVDRVVGVLQEVRARLPGQVVRPGA